MKTAILVLVFTATCFAAPRKPAHVATESEMCWRDVQLLADFDFSTQDNDNLQAGFNRMYSCSETLKADKLKSRMALLVSVIAAQAMAINKQRQELADTKQSLVNAEHAKVQSDGSLRVVLQEYDALQGRYNSHLKQDVVTANELQAALAQFVQAPAPVQQQQRGGFRGALGNALQSMGDAMQAEARKPTVHCEATTFGNQTSMDCK